MSKDMLLMRLIFPLFLLVAPLPDPTHLANDWWRQYEEGTDEAVDLTSLIDLASSLPAEEKEKADIRIEQLTANLQTLEELKGEAVDPATTPPVLRDSYSLDQMLAVVELSQEARQTVATLERRVANSEARVALARSHQNELNLQYRDEATPSAQRFLLGLRVMVGRSTVAILQQRVRLLREELKRSQRIAGYLTAEQKHAREHLQVKAEEVEQLQGEREVAEEAVRIQQEAVIAAQVANGGVGADEVIQRLERNLALARAQVALIGVSMRYTFASLLNNPTEAELEELEQSASAGIQRLEEIREELEIWEDEADLQIERASQGGNDPLEQRSVILIGEIREGRHEVGRAEVVAKLTASRLREEAHNLRSWWGVFLNWFCDLWTGLVGLLGVTLFSVGELPITLLDITRFLLIIIGGFILSWAVRLFFGWFTKRRHAHLSAGSLYVLKRVTHYVIILLALVVAVASVGLDLDRILLVFGALSVGIGFGLQGVASNFVAGLSILLGRKLKVGDIIEVQPDSRGTVQTIHLLNTVIRTFDGLDMVLPNALLLSQPFQNWTMHDPFRRFVVPFSVAYGSDKELVRQAGLEAADTIDVTLKGHKRVRDPLVRLISFGESSLNFELVVWVNVQQARRYGHIVAEYNWALEEALTRHGLIIPFPQRDIHIKESLPLASNSPSV